MAEDGLRPRRRRMTVNPASAVRANVPGSGTPTMSAARKASSCD